MKKKLYINAGVIIVNLLREGNLTFLTYERIKKLTNYIYNQLYEQNNIKDYQDIIVNVNFDSVERTVLYNNHVFGLDGSTVYLEQDTIPESLFEAYKTDETVMRIIRKFAHSDVV
jgi:hypothetical protein